MEQCATPGPPDLTTAVAKAKATDEILHVVDESLKRAAEAREQREKLEAERREREERDNRIEEAKRQEEESARRLTERNERLAEDIAAREAARRALAHGKVWPLDVVI